MSNSIYFTGDFKALTLKEAPAGDAHHLATVLARATSLCIIRKIKSGMKSRDSLLMVL